MVALYRQVHSVLAQALGKILAQQLHESTHLGKTKLFFLLSKMTLSLSYIICLKTLFTDAQPAGPPTQHQGGTRRLEDEKEVQHGKSLRR